MAWIYLVGSEDSHLHLETGSGQLLTVKTIDTPNLSSYQEWVLGTSLGPRYGMTSLPYDPRSLRMKSILSTGDFHARTSVLQALEKAWKESEVLFIGTCIGLLANLTPDSCFWKTCLPSLLEVVPKWSNRLPKSGMTVDGHSCQPPQLAQTIKDKDGGCWPTPTVKGNHNRKGSSRKSADGLETAVKKYPTPVRRDFISGKGQNYRKYRRNSPSLSEEIGGTLNPPWVEWLMGYPIGWTELSPWVTQWFRAKRAKRSRS